MSAVSVCVLVFSVCVADVNGLTARYCTLLQWACAGIPSAMSLQPPVQSLLRSAFQQGREEVVLVGGWGRGPFHDCDGGWGVCDHKVSLLAL